MSIANIHPVLSKIEHKQQPLCKSREKGCSNDDVKVWVLTVDSSQAER